MISNHLKKKDYYFEYDDIMVASGLMKPEKFNNGVVVKPVVSEADWEQVVKLDIEVAQDTSKDYVVFVNRIVTKWRECCAANQCIWMGAYLNGQLVADLGMFQAGESMGLAAMVKTHPEFRKQGICRTLLYEASQIGFDQMRFKKIAMVADKAYASGRVYRDVGYKVEEQGASLILNSI